ncbi:hypothetical protein Tco_0822415 [Tanacetum coccineum]|uniref:Uncharacterized protein n=1 Tax=Tanacetum coccineum TaxID=301880 RepID=A0ABQ5AJ74_9ASTR
MNDNKELKLARDAEMLDCHLEKIWDFNQNIKPMDEEQASKKKKSPKKERSTEKIVEEEAVTQEEREEVVKEPAQRERIYPKNYKAKTKLEEDAEKRRTQGISDKVQREEAPKRLNPFTTKFPIVDWKTVCYKTFQVLIKFSEVMEAQRIIRLVKERYSTSAPEGFDLMLWGDLHTLFEPDKDDEIWRDQHEYNLLSWRLCDFCGIHILLMDNGLAIHMLTEKKYPLSQEMLSKMLSRKLEVDHESSQAFELLRFIRAQVQK